MELPIKKVVEETNRLKLNAPEWYYKVLNNAPELIDKIANGVGSETSWTYHLTPDTIWGLNINPTSHAHDYMYSIPYKFKSVAQGLAWKRLADHYFDINCRIQIKDYAGWLESWRYDRVDKYNIALNIGGSEAFWINKELPKDYDKYYSTSPINDVKIIQMYKDILAQIITMG